MEDRRVRKELQVYPAQLVHSHQGLKILRIISEDCSIPASSLWAVHMTRALGFAAAPRNLSLQMVETLPLRVVLVSLSSITYIPFIAFNRWEVGGEIGRKCCNTPARNPKTWSLYRTHCTGKSHVLSVIRSALTHSLDQPICRLMCTAKFA